MPKRYRDHHEGLIEDLMADPLFAIEYLRASLEDSREMFVVALSNVAEAFLAKRDSAVLRKPQEGA